MVGKIACAVGFHSCVANSDEQAVWGECVRCHRKFGITSRYAIRAYIEAEAQREAAALAPKDHAHD